MVRDLARETQTLRALLDGAEFSYHVRGGDGTLPVETPAVAEFSHEVVGHAPIEIVAVVLGDELRVASSAVMPWGGSVEQLAWCFFVNLEWAFGNLHLNSTQDALHASVSMYLGSGLPGRNEVRFLVTHLADSVRCLREGELPYFQSPFPGSTDLDRVRQSLREVGVEPTVSPDGNTLVEKFLQRGVPLLVAFYLFDEGSLLNVQCQFGPGWRVADPGQVVMALQEINRQLSYGSVSYHAPSSSVRYHMGIPIAWGEPNAAMMKWAISKSLFVMLDMVMPRVAIQSPSSDG